MDKTIELVNSVKDIQAMPSVIVKVLNVMRKPTCSMTELGNIVMYDQSLVIKLLALVNSAYYGFSQQISSISVALSILGMVKIKNIIVAVAMKPMMSSAGDKDLWKHSLCVAVGCEYFANTLKIMDPDEAFMAGFLHDVGKIVLNNVDSKLYNKVVDVVKTGKSVLDVEQKYFDSNHVRTGALLVKRWQLPILIANVVSYHHNPSLSSVPIPCNLVCMVDALVKENPTEDMFDSGFMHTLGLEFPQMEALRKEILKRAEVLYAELT